MPALERLGEVNRYRNSSHCLRAIRRPGSLRLLTARPSCAEANAQRVGRAQPAGISASLGVFRDYLNLKWFHSYACACVLTRDFIQIFNFSQSSWGRVGGGVLRHFIPYDPAAPGTHAIGCYLFFLGGGGLIFNVPPMTAGPQNDTFSPPCSGVCQNGVVRQCAI